MFEIEIIRHGWPGAQLRLTTFETRLSHMEETLLEATDLVYEHTRQWFESEGEGTWPPLAESTVQRKASQGYSEPAKPLFATGNLFESVTSPYGPYSTRVINPHAAVIGVDWSSGGWQIPVILSEGDDSMPARSIFHVDDQLVAEITGLIETRIWNPVAV